MNSPAGTFAASLSVLNSIPISPLWTIPRKLATSESYATTNVFAPAAFLQRVGVSNRSNLEDIDFTYNGVPQEGAIFKKLLAVVVIHLYGFVRKNTLQNGELEISLKQNRYIHTYKRLH